MDVFRELKKSFPGVMTEFYGRCGIGRRRRMIAGNFTGPELKIIIRERSLVDLAKIIPNGVEVTRYLRSMRELHRMAVRKEYSQDHQTFINHFEECFRVVFNLGLVNFTTKVHIIIHHMGYYMRTTKESLYSADTSATESSHSGLLNLQRIHGLLSTHNLGTPDQQKRLKRSLMRYNWGNLPFDMRKDTANTPDQDPADAPGQSTADDDGRQEDISLYQVEVDEMEAEVCDGESESDKQVYSELTVTYS